MADPTPDEHQPQVDAHPLDPRRHHPLELTSGEGPVLLVGTRKGTWALSADHAREQWRLTGPVFLGHIVNHAIVDPRDRRTILLAIRAGHLGPTIFRSTDLGKSWTEASRPPAFPKAREGETPRVVEYSAWLTPGHASEPGVWYAGTSPQALFRSEDHGATWDPVAGFNDHPMWATWTGDGSDDTPDGPMCHSILIDPRDPAHMYLGLSGGGFFESTDKGADWAPLNKGSLADFAPDPYPEFGQDPHRVALHPMEPDLLYQQNHCGIYKLRRPESVWQRIGDNMPRDVGDVGFSIVLHPRDPNTVWVFPMDGTDVWPRTSPGGKAAVYVTRDGGESWRRQDNGLPQNQAWFTVKRQAMVGDALDPVGLYFGTTGGEIWASNDEGTSWKRIAEHLPHIYSLEAIELGS